MADGSSQQTQKRLPWFDLASYGLRVLMTETSSGQRYLVLGSRDPAETTTEAKARLSQVRDNLRQVLSREPGREVYGKPSSSQAYFYMTGAGLEGIGAIHDALKRGFPDLRMVKAPTNQVFFREYQQWLVKLESGAITPVGDGAPAGADQRTTETGQSDSPTSEGSQPQSQDEVGPTNGGGQPTEGEVDPAQRGGSGNVQQEGTVNNGDGRQAGPDEGGSDLGGEMASEGNVQPGGLVSDDGEMVVISADASTATIEAMLDGGRTVVADVDGADESVRVIEVGDGSGRHAIELASAAGGLRTVDDASGGVALPYEQALSEAAELIRARANAPGTMADHVVQLSGQGQMDTHTLEAMLDRGQMVSVASGEHSREMIGLYRRDQRWMVQLRSANGQQLIGDDPREPAMTRQQAINRGIIEIRGRMAQAGSWMPPTAVVEKDADDWPPALHEVSDDPGITDIERSNVVINQKVDNDTLEAALAAGYHVQPENVGSQRQQAVMVANAKETFGVALRTSPTLPLTFIPDKDAEPTNESPRELTRRGVIAMRRILAGDNVEQAAEFAREVDVSDGYPPGYASSLGVVGHDRWAVRVDSAVVDGEIREHLSNGKRVVVDGHPQGLGIEVQVNDGRIMYEYRAVLVDDALQRRMVSDFGQDRERVYDQAVAAIGQIMRGEPLSTIAPAQNAPVADPVQAGGNDGTLEPGTGETAGDEQKENTDATAVPEISDDGSGAGDGLESGRSGSGAGNDTDATGQSVSGSVDGGGAGDNAEGRSDDEHGPTERTRPADTGDANSPDPQDLFGVGAGAAGGGVSGGTPGGSSDDGASMGGEPGGSLEDGADAPAGEAGGDSAALRGDGDPDSGSAAATDNGPGEPAGGDSRGEAPADAGPRTGHGGDGRSAGTASAASAGQLSRFRHEPGHDQAGKSAEKRCEDNIEAMERLFEIEAEGRTPTDDDKAVLAEFSGWGGISAHFLGYWDGEKSNYVKTAEQTLKNWTRDDTTDFDSKDLDSIKSTILNAYFTHSGVVAPMWRALADMGVSMERVVEPSCGSLDFINYAPYEVTPGNVTGVEIDRTTARVAQALHPESMVYGKALEKAGLPENFYDLSITNVPFGNYKVYDRDRPQWRDSIHNYFVKKQLDLLRPGGVAAFVISRYFMDSEDDSVRQYVMENAHVANVIRLPNGAFQQNSGTDVATDIVVVQKKGDFEPNFTPLDIGETALMPMPLAASASQVTDDGETVEPNDPVSQRINAVLADNPERIVGDAVTVTGRFGLEPAFHHDSGIDALEASLTEAFAATTPKAISQPPRAKSPGVKDVREQFEKTVLRPDSDQAQPGEIAYNDQTATFHQVVEAGDELVLSETPIRVAKKDTERMKGLIDLMATTRELLELEASGSDEAIEQRAGELRAQLNEQYDAFTQRFGALMSKQNRKLYKLDVREPFLYGLEYEDPETKEVTKSALFEKRTVSVTASIPETADNLTDAMALSLTYTGEVSPAFMADLLGGEYEDNPDAVTQALIDSDMAFLDPESEKPVSPEAYLSGNLRPKITAAEAAAASDTRFARNVEALKDALPEPLSPSQIKVGIDAFWMPKQIVHDFLSDAMGLATTGVSGVEPFFDEENRYWQLRPSKANTSMAEVARRQEEITMHRFGTERCNALQLLGHAFTNTLPTVRDKIQDNPPKYEVNESETLKAQGKLEEIKEAFSQWVFRDGNRARQLTDIYNERFNTIRMHEPDGSHMVYPGMAAGWVPRKHQNDFCWRALSGANAMTAHVVGAGKTFQLVSTAIRGKQMGRWNKPMCVVPNHMLRQFAGDAQSLYPSARILVMDKEDITPAKRDAFVARAAAGDWDLIVCTHSSFSRIPVPEDFEVKMLEDEKARLKEALEREARENNSGKKTPSEKDIEKKLKNMQEKLERKMDEISKGQNSVLNLREMGVDHLGIDEAHYYKNLAPDTAKSIPGLSVKESVRAWDMLMKCRYMDDLHGGPYGILMATGTPISNSLVECYTFTRMLRPDLLESMEIHNFNDWMSLFAEVQTHLEIKPEGGGYQNKARLSQFKNVPELVKMFRQFVDVKTREDLNLPSPDVEHETVVAEQTPLMAAFMKYIEARARGVRNPEPTESDDNGGQDFGHVAEELAQRIRHRIHGANDAGRLDEHGVLTEIEKLPQDILLSIATDGRKASLDPRLIHPELPDDPGSKVNLMIEKSMEVYRKYDEEKALQLIFCDFSSPTGKGRFNLYDDIKAKLIEQGVPESEIAYIHDAKTDEDKEKMFEKARNGEIRWLLGSTDKMGVGTNVQDRLVAMHQLDPPWRPTDVSQRLGRMDRQGNQFDQCYNYVYTTQDSFDLFIWETLKRKQRMIDTAMRHPDDCERTIEEESEISFEDVLQVTTGNERIKDFMDAQQQLDKLKRFRDSHINDQADLGERIEKHKNTIERMQGRLELMEEDQAAVEANLPLHLEVSGAHPGLQEGDACHIGGVKGLADAIESQHSLTRAYTTREIGHFGGLKVLYSRKNPNSPVLWLERSSGDQEQVKGINLDDMNKDDAMNPFEKAARALKRQVERIHGGQDIERQRELIQNRQRDLDNAREDYGKEFPRQQELEDMEQRYQQLLEEVGSELDNNKGMDPEPVIEWLRYINEYTSTPLYSDQVEDLIGDADIHEPEDDQDQSESIAMA